MENLNTDKEDWSKIHPKFAEINKESDLQYYNHHNLKTYQQEWEEWGLTYYYAEQWVDSCLPISYCHLAAYAKGEGYSDLYKVSIEKISQDYLHWRANLKNGKEALNFLYPAKVRKDLRCIRIYNLNLTDELVINSQEWSSLKEIHIYNNQLTSLTFISCENLEIIYCSENQLTSLELLNCQHLVRIYASNNQLTSLKITNCPNLRELNLDDNHLTWELTVFSKLTSLEKLSISNNQFTDSLVPLQNLTNLKQLNISNTQLNSGLEFLPESLEWFYSYQNFLEEELNKYKLPFSSNNHLSLLNRWRVVNFLKVREARKPLLQNPLQLLESQLTTKEKEIQLKEQLIQALKEQLELTIEEKIKLKELEKEKLQLEAELADLKAKYQELLSNELKEQLTNKEKELVKLKAKFIKEEFATEMLLKAVDNLTTYDVSAQRDAQQELRRESTEHLIKKGFKQTEITELCNLQTEVTQLKLRINEAWGQKTKLLIEAKEKRQQITYFVNQGVINYGNQNNFANMVISHNQIELVEEVNEEVVQLVEDASEFRY